MPVLPSTFPAIDDDALSEDSPGGAALEAWGATQVEKLYNLPEKIGVIERTDSSTPPRLSSYEWASVFTVPVWLPPGCKHIEARGLCRIGGSTSDAGAAQLKLGVFLPDISQQGNFSDLDPEVVVASNPITIDSLNGGETTFQQAQGGVENALAVNVSQVDTSRARQAIVCVMIRTAPVNASINDPTGTSGVAQLGSLFGQRTEVSNATSDPDRHTALLNRDLPSEDELYDLLRPYPSTSEVDLSYLVWPPSKATNAGTTVGLVDLHWVQFEALTLRMVPQETRSIDADGGGYQAGEQMRFDRATGDLPRESRTAFRRYRHHNTHWHLGDAPNEGWGQANRWIYVDDDESDIQIQSAVKKQHTATKLWVDMLCLGVILPAQEGIRRSPVRSPAGGDSLADLESTDGDIEVGWEAFNPVTGLIEADGTATETINFWPVTYTTVVPILQQMGVQWLTDSTGNNLAQSFREGLLYLESSNFEDLLTLSRFRFEIAPDTDISGSLLELKLDIGHPATAISSSRIIAFPPTVHETLPLDE